MGIVRGVLCADFDAVVPRAGTDNWGQRGVNPKGFDDGASRDGGPAVIAAVDLNTAGHTPGFDALVEVGGAAEAPGKKNLADFELLDDLNVSGCLTDENESFVDGVFEHGFQVVTDVVSMNSLRLLRTGHTYTVILIAPFMIPRSSSSVVPIPRGN